MDVDSNKPQYVGVREAARRLGVHENTVRNWARDGMLPTARMPGARFHRFDARAVERLRDQRSQAVPSVAEERRTIGPELVDATQLSHWATTRDAQDTLPELVRRLLVSTPGVTNVSVRSGEGVSAPGWDGRAESTGSAFLPSGELYFEFGVGGRPKAKADADYAKRRGDPLGVSPSQVTFVFITPRRWSDAAAWATARRAEGPFAHVQVLDADDLEGWLQATPVVHYWISEHLGRRPRDAETLETWWARFQAQTDPPLPPALQLAGRDRERDRLKEFFGSPPGVVTVQTAWRDEAVAFVCATIDAITGDESTSVQPPLVVSSAEVWDRVVAQRGRMTLVPLFESPDIGAALAGGHHVVLTLGREGVVLGEKIELPRPARDLARQALESVGIDFDRAYRLAGLARRSFRSLLRKLARDPRLVRPPWSQAPDGSVFARLVLAGGWTSSDEDRNLVSRLADVEWSVLERILMHWRASDDPPFVQSGAEWHLASPEEAFLVLQHALTSDDLDRWAESVVEVLTETDPRLQLAPERRVVAGVMGFTRAHSQVLRRGLGQGIALLGSSGGERLGDAVTAADHAEAVVRQILARANEDASGRTWWSLADVLPLLAEAAPTVFLDAVHDDLDRDEPLLATMFQDGDRTSSLYGSSPHTGLQWALETLCWSPDYVLEATRALARLDLVDPGGRLSNRPLESLRSVLAGWIRHTGADLDGKVSAVEYICRQLPDVGWRLLLALWPSYHASSSPPASPRFREDWKPDSRGVPISDWVDYIDHLVGLAIELADRDVARWAALAERLGPLPNEDRSRLLDTLDVVAQSEWLSHDDSLVLWEQLHTEISRHRRFATAAWSMDDTTLSRMQTIADRLKPSLGSGRFGYLFDWRPDLPDVALEDHDGYNETLLQLRTQAVIDTLEAASILGLRELAARSPVPRQLGWVVGAVASDELTPELLTWLDSTDPQLREVALAWASRRSHIGGASWLREVLARPEMTPEQRRTSLVLEAPATTEIWDVLLEVDPELSDAYWKGMAEWHVPPAETERAVRELLAHNRVWIAVDLLATEAHRTEGVPTRVTPKLVEEVLEAATTADPRQARAQAAGYEIGVLLDFLEARDAAVETLIRYELVFFRLLEHLRQPRALFANLGENPALFVDLVKRVYRGKDEPKRQLDDDETNLAHHAWWVLSEWTQVPGLRDDGTIDGEHLKNWAREARLALAEADRADIGDEQLGQVLATSPPGADGIWPAEPIREMIEAIGSTSLEAGIHMGLIHHRGVTMRGVYDGGALERDLAKRYGEAAKQTAREWPRTSRLLRRLSVSYERDAQREDAEAEVRGDTE